MKVKLKFGWFAPGSEGNMGGRKVSGAFYPKGIHSFPESMRDKLPSSAMVMDEDAQEYVPVAQTLRDFDEERPAFEAEAQVHDSLAKARAALAAKRREKAIEKATE